MNILVCLKQVPDTNDITWSENNTIDRENVSSILNPLDDYTLELAKKIRTITDEISITTLSMGPIQAKSILTYSIARCADNAILLSDKYFSASDTWATSYIISSAIKKLNLKPDIILCSLSAADGETGQTPAGIAQFLGLPYISNVSDVIRFYKNENKMLISQKINNFTNMIEAEYPICLSCKPEFNLTPVKIFEHVKSQNSLVSVYSMEDLDIDFESIGIKGSKTLVKKAYKKESNREAQILNSEDGFSEIVSILSQEVDLEK